MRPARIITAVVLTAAVAATGAYIAHATTDRAAAPAAPAAAASTALVAAPPAAASGSPATKNASTEAGGTKSQPAVLADGRHPVLIKAVDAGRGRITFDVIQFFMGDVATREAAKDHQESPPPNDIYIRNVSPRLRTLPVLAGAAITANGSVGTQKSTPVSLTKLATLPLYETAV